MHYPTHCTGMVVPVTASAFEVTAIGWGDNHEILQTNEYNPFWDTTALFKTSGGHPAAYLCSGM
jgi:hypothetical protein